ncbi:MAG: Gfo/Idh/MocA family oxidoreductase [Planctomycetota bacterium]|jgi:hypothetical protein
MKFLLLGWSPAVEPLLRAIAASDHETLIAASELLSTDVSRLLELAPGTRVVDGWESLLGELSADACIVAGHSDEVLEGARHLASDGRPIVLVPEASQGTAFVYELTLNRDDTGTPLMAVPHLARHELCTRLQQTIRDEAIGDVVLFRIERSLASGSPDSATFLSCTEIDAALMGDVALLRELGGDYSRVTAVRSTGAVEQEISLASVTLGGDELAEATWSARVGQPSWRLEVTGTHGTAVIDLEPDLLSGKLAVSTGDEGQTTEDSTSDGSRLGATQLAAILQPLDVQQAAWAEMTRTMETVEATHTSIRRRRTVDLFFETTSERAIFKSQMTAVGCGLLLLTLFMLVAFLVLGAMLDSRSIVQRNAEADGRVLHVAEFEPESVVLTQSGKKHLRDLARRMSRSPEPVFVMPEKSAGNEELDDSRVLTVVDFLIAAGQPESALYVDLASIPHPATVLLLTVLKYLWIAPLVIFLVLQSLIALAKPSQSERVAGDIE